MADASSVEIRYSGKDLASHGATPATQTADAGGSKTTVIDAALTQGDDYWNGALLEWLTGGNAGLWSSVKDFTASTDTITLDEGLPTTVAAGDTYRLLLPLGAFMASLEITSLVPSATVNVTGVVFARVAGMNGPGNGTIAYVHNGGGAARALKWTAPGGSAGSEVVVGAANGDYVLFDANLDKWVKVTVTIASLPTSDKTDTITLSGPRHRAMGPALGTETEAGVTRHHLVVVRTDSDITNIKAMLNKGIWWDDSGVEKTASDTTAASAYNGSGAVTVSVASASTWPKSGFLKNSITGEVMQWTSRDGNSITVPASGRGVRGTTAAAGSNGDAMILVPNVDIGLEAPLADAYQQITGEGTAPAGVVFSTPITEATALAIPDLLATKHYGVWLREILVAGTPPTLNAADYLEILFDV